jgi:hypothetical protein
MSTGGMSGGRSFGGMGISSPRGFNSAPRGFSAGPGGGRIGPQMFRGGGGGGGGRR